LSALLTLQQPQLNSEENIHLTEVVVTSLFLCFVSTNLIHTKKNTYITVKNRYNRYLTVIVSFTTVICFNTVTTDAKVSAIQSCITFSLLVQINFLLIIWKALLKALMMHASQHTISH